MGGWWGWVNRGGGVLSGTPSARSSRQQQHDDSGRQAPRSRRVSPAVAGKAGMQQRPGRTRSLRFLGIPTSEERGRGWRPAPRPRRRRSQWSVGGAGRGSTGSSRRRAQAVGRGAEVRHGCRANGRQFTASQQERQPHACRPMASAMSTNSSGRCLALNSCRVRVRVGGWMGKGVVHASVCWPDAAKAGAVDAGAAAKAAAW